MFFEVSEGFPVATDSSRPVRSIAEVIFDGQRVYASQISIQSSGFPRLPARKPVKTYKE